MKYCYYFNVLFSGKSILCLNNSFVICLFYIFLLPYLALNRSCASVYYPGTLIWSLCLIQKSDCPANQFLHQYTPSTKHSVHSVYSSSKFWDDPIISPKLLSWEVDSYVLKLHINFKRSCKFKHQQRFILFFMSICACSMTLISMQLVCFVAIAFSKTKKNALSFSYLSCMLQLKWILLVLRFL